MIPTSAARPPVEPRSFVHSPCAPGGLLTSHLWCMDPAVGSRLSTAGFGNRAPPRLSRGSCPSQLHRLAVLAAAGPRVLRGPLPVGEAVVWPHPPRRRPFFAAGTSCVPLACDRAGPPCLDGRCRSGILEGVNPKSEVFWWTQSISGRKAGCLCGNLSDDLRRQGAKAAGGFPNPPDSE